MAAEDALSLCVLPNVRNQQLKLAAQQKCTHQRAVVAAHDGGPLVAPGASAMLTQALGAGAQSDFQGYTCAKASTVPSSSLLSVTLLPRRELQAGSGRKEEVGHQAAVSPGLGLSIPRLKNHCA